ncbi:MAG: hypothetical protein HXX17_11420 [Geobacteraceae bacterium]|nr:hypothetical protein [Geobacteraceae bacterium]
MKKIIIAVSAVLSLAVAAVAVAEDKVTGDVYINPASKYVFRGLDLSQSRGVMQGGVDVSYKNFTVSYWSNEQMFSGYDPATTFKAGQTTETDITLNYAYTPVEALTLNVGNTYYTLSGAPNTNEVYLKATLNKLLSPTFAVYYDWDKSRNTGLFYSLSVGHTVELAKNLGLNLGALASYNMENPSASAVKYNNLDNYELSASVDYSINDKFKVTPNYLYSNAFNSAGRIGGVKNQSIVGLKAAFVF